jgi:hypothetical protein
MGVMVVTQGCSCNHSRSPGHSKSAQRGLSYRHPPNSSAKQLPLGNLDDILSLATSLNLSIIDCPNSLDREDIDDHLFFRFSSSRKPTPDHL